MRIAGDDTFREAIREQGVTIVDFDAPYCPPCKVLLPILEQLGGEYGDRVSIVKVNCDDAPNSASEYGIMSTPTVIVFHNGEPVEKLIGLRPKSVYASVVARYLTS